MSLPAYRDLSETQMRVVVQQTLTKVRRIDNGFISVLMNTVRYEMDQPVNLAFGAS